MKGFRVATTLATAAMVAATIWLITTPGETPRKGLSSNVASDSATLPAVTFPDKDDSAAVCVLMSADGSSVKGTLVFRPSGSAVEISGTVEGLPPGRYQFEVTEFGDPRGIAAGSFGGICLPQDALASLPPDCVSVDDLMCFEVDASGTTRFQQINPLLKFYNAETLIGRAFVLYDRTASGSEGGQVAYGVIGRANPNWVPPDGPALTRQGETPADRC